jgi:hypothetical protein
LFVNIEFRERQKADFEPSSHFVKILLVVCQNCLNQLDVNKQSLNKGSLFYSHCELAAQFLLEPDKDNFFTTSDLIFFVKSQGGDRPNYSNFRLLIAYNDGPDGSFHQSIGPPPPPPPTI